jgi:LDH2 family malate/lactate/ureidoglycolate dehydrogenase
VLCADRRVSFDSEADSSFVNEGSRPRINQVFFVIDSPVLVAIDVLSERIETLVAAMLTDLDVQMHGQRCHAVAQIAQDHGIEVPAALLSQLEQLAQS